ncbi:phosphatidate cytidylyltransferase [bacterium]|jgi:phosphatidate cytidylyltransferase|nr:phosphatidate cytidylyltransferase [bacterium]
MILRAFTGAVIVGLIVASIWYGHLTFQCLWLLLMGIGFSEARGMNPAPYMGMTFPICSLIWIGSCAVYIYSGSLTFLLSGLLFSLFLFFAFGISDFREDCKEEYFREFSSSFLLFGYVGVFYTPMLYIAEAFTPAKSWLFFLFLIMWLQDTFAYLGGRIFGRRPLSTQLSPKKTWEGALVGLITACIIVGLLHSWFPDPDPASLVFLALVIGLAGQAGDLMESFLKRSFQVKDSGMIFPGHGGVLDRFDSVVAGSIVFLTLVIPET